MGQRRSGIFGRIDKHEAQASESAGRMRISLALLNMQSGGWRVEIYLDELSYTVNP